MKTYLNDKSFYAMDKENKLIYKCNAFESYDGYDSIYFTLELVCGWDYVNPDENNIQGWVKAENFCNDVQEILMICYIFEESVNECLEAHDLIICKCPKGFESFN